MTVKRKSSTVVKPVVGHIKDFKVYGRIGSGGSAEVLKAKCLTEGFAGKYFAIKKIRKNGHKVIKRINNEIEIHSHVHSTSVVKFYASFDDEEYSYIVLDFCEKGSLQDYLKEKRALPEEEARYVIKQVIDGVICLHAQGIIHRDLSLKNLLLTYEDEVKTKYTVKIADFGLAKFIGDCKEETAVVGTFDYMAPEVFNGFYDFKTDCWSVGCVLYALLFGAPPFHSKKKNDIKADIMKSELFIPCNASAEAEELLKKLLEKNPSDRISMTDALKLPFFQQNEQVKNTYKSKYRRNGDSGVNSKSSSSSSFRCNHKTYEPYDRGSSEIQTYNENISNNGYQDQYTRHENKPDNHVNLKTAAKCSSDFSKSRCVRDQFKSKLNILPPKPANPDSRQYRTRVKEREISSQMHGSEHDDYCYKTSTRIFQGNGQKCSSHNLECGSPEISSIHNSNCSDYHSSSSLHKRRDSSFRSNETKSRQMKNVPYKSIKEVRTPLNTSRLKSCTKRITENKIVSILDDGQVRLELLKLEESKEYVFCVYLISHDGMQIKVFNPQEQVLSSDFSNKEFLTSDRFYKKYKCFTFENLSEYHWKRYKFAKLFVDEVKAVTQKVVIWGTSAKCAMMENAPNPNYEMQFYNGYQITDIGNKITIKDRNGKHVTENSRNTQKMLDELEEMKEMCKAVEIFSESKLKCSFPIRMRLGHQYSNKENMTPRYSPLLNGTNASMMKSWDRSKIINSSGISNIPQRSMSSVEKHVTPPYRKMTEIQKDLENCQLVGEKWVSAKYKDGIEMWISLEDDEYFFREINTQRKLPMDPDLKERFHRDSPNILRHTFFKQVKKKP